MNKLKQLQAIQSKLMKVRTRKQATAEIARLMDSEVNTVQGWLTKTQHRPIPDKALALLKLFANSHSSGD